MERAGRHKRAGLRKSMHVNSNRVQHNSGKACSGDQSIRFASQMNPSESNSRRFPPPSIT